MRASPPARTLSLLLALLVAGANPAFAVVHGEAHHHEASHERGAMHAPEGALRVEPADHEHADLAAPLTSRVDPLCVVAMPEPNEPVEAEPGSSAMPTTLAIDRYGGPARHAPTATRAPPLA